MTKEDARKYAEERLLEILRTQPGLLTLDGLGTKGDALAAYCLAFIDRYSAALQAP